MTFFAIIKNGDKIVYGIGHTVQEAWEDARNWSKKLDQMHIAKCSAEFCEYVEMYGGDFEFVEHSGTAYLLREWYQIVSELTGQKRAENHAVPEVI